MLYTEAGLCNRLRVIDSALIFAEALGCVATIYWPENSACGTTFSKIFQPLAAAHLVEGPVNEVQEKWKRSVGTKNFQLRRFLGLAFLWEDDVRGNCRELLGKVKGLTFRPRIALKTEHAFCYPERFDKFIPVPELSHKIADIRTRIPPHTVGIHIRRGDHVSAIKNSPLEGFKRHISARLHGVPHATFFLSTDAPEVKDSLRQKFGDAIVTIDHELSRTSVDGIGSAVIDLWVLSSCAEVWGSRGSSFSESAYHISGKQLELFFIDGPKLVNVAGKQ